MASEKFKPSPDEVLSDPHHVDIDRVKQAEISLLEAEAATEQEHRMGLIQAIKRYPKAATWSLLISFAVVMEGRSSESLLGHD